MGTQDHLQSGHYQPYLQGMDKLTSYYLTNVVIKRCSPHCTGGASRELAWGRVSRESLGPGPEGSYLMQSVPLVVTLSLSSVL